MFSKKKVFAPVICVLVSLTALAQQKTPILNHVALYVQDLKKSSNFYQHIIQLDTVPEPFHDGRHVWLAIGGTTTLHLIAGASMAAQNAKNTHICFSAPSFDSFIANLTKAGIAYEDLKGNRNMITNRVDGVKQIYLQDPDGYWIEVNSDMR